MLAALIYWLSRLTGFAGCVIILAAFFCWLCQLPGYAGQHSCLAMLDMLAS